MNRHLEKLLCHLILNLYYDLILGKGRAERNGISYIAKDRVLKLDNKNHSIKILEIGLLDFELTKSHNSQIQKVRRISASVFTSHTIRARRQVKE